MQIAGCGALDPRNRHAADFDIVGRDAGRRVKAIEHCARLPVDGVNNLPVDGLFRPLVVPVIDIGRRHRPAHRRGLVRRVIDEGHMIIVGDVAPAGECRQTQNDSGAIAPPQLLFVRLRARGIGIAVIVPAVARIVPRLADPVRRLVIIEAGA